MIWRRWLKGEEVGRSAPKPPGYSRYTDPDVFPVFGGDEFDPPPYATDRRSTVDKPRTDKSRGEMACARLGDHAFAAE
jgi:hypothetical protein